MGNYQEWRNGKDRLKKGYYETEFLWKCRCLVVKIYSTQENGAMQACVLDARTPVIS